MSERARAILKKLIQDGKDAEDKLKSLDRIRVPEGIRFRECEDDKSGDKALGRALLFNNGKQSLWYHHNYSQWAVTSWGISSGSDEKDLYLEPCKREDLKAGDWAYATDSDEPLFKSISSYWLVCGGKKATHVVTNGSAVSWTDIRYEHWYKVTQ